MCIAFPILPHQGRNSIQPLTLIPLYALDMHMMTEISEDVPFLDMSLMLCYVMLTWGSTCIDTLLRNI